MKVKIIFNLNFTTTKLLSYFIFFGATITALYLKDKTVFVEGLMYSSLLQGIKAITQIKPLNTKSHEEV